MRSNDEGNGFAPDQTAMGEEPTVNELSAEFGDLVLRANTDGDVAIYRDGRDAVLVGHAHGAWCVRVPGKVVNLLDLQSTETLVIATFLGCKPDAGLVNKLNKLHRDGFPEEGVSYGDIYRAFLTAEVAGAAHIVGSWPMVKTS
jgi:prevent-host-death family protein